MDNSDRVQVLHRTHQLDKVPPGRLLWESLKSITETHVHDWAGQQFEHDKDCIFCWVVDHFNELYNVRVLYPSENIKF